MNKNNQMPIIWKAIFIIGIIILMSSVNIGENKMIRIMDAYGGSMDTTQYIIFFEGTIQKYQLLGLIISILGLFGIFKGSKTE